MIFLVAQKEFPQINIYVRCFVGNDSLASPHMEYCLSPFSFRSGRALFSLLFFPS
jgi:hypothetical protein